jgi:hypothetical protein
MDVFIAPSNVPDAGKLADLLQAAGYSADLYQPELATR